jgi:uncharacterized protein (TIGR03437 family)
MPGLILFLLAVAAAPAVAQQNCTFTLNPASRSVPATPDTVGSITVNASQSNCARVAVSDNPAWLTISFGSPGTGNGTIGYRVEANTTGSIRNGSIQVGNARFTVTQAAADCLYELSPLTARVLAAAGTGTIRVTTRCQWTAASNASWLQVTPGTGIGDGTISYSYEANRDTQARNAAITIGNRTFALTQEGAVCSTMLSPATFAIPGEGGSGSVAVTSTCAWRAAASAAWITIGGPGSGTGNGTVPFTVDPNTTTQPRSATLTIGDQSVVINQAASNLPRITGIVNAASYSREAAAPGTIVAIFGSLLGPAALAGLQLTADGQFLTKEIAGTRVLFDGTPAPLIYSSADVLSAIVPYDTAGKRTVPVVVEYQGRRSVEATLAIANTGPALFTANASGTGQAAALNEDFSLNTPENPAARGSLLVLYGTGEGLTLPASVDGKLTGADLPQAVAGVSVSIGGALAEVFYKGGVPGVTAGLVQINVRVPAAAPVGPAVPVIVTIGGIPSQNGVTVAVR